MTAAAMEVAKVAAAAINGIVVFRFPNYGTVERISSGIAGLRYAVADLHVCEDVDLWRRFIVESTYPELYEQVQRRCELAKPLPEAMLKYSLWPAIKRENAQILRLFIACGFSEWRIDLSLPMPTTLLSICLAGGEMRHDRNLYDVILSEKWSQVALFIAAGVTLRNAEYEFWFPSYSHFVGKQNAVSAEIYKRLLHRRPGQIRKYRRILDKEKQRLEAIRFSLIQRRATQVCIGLQSLELPALVTLHIVDAVLEKTSLPPVPVHLKYRLITTVKHFPTIG